MAVSAWVNQLRILVLVMWFASWNHYRWSIVAASFCHITPACRLKQALSKAVQSFLTELDNYTLADLVEENQPLYKLLLVE